MDSLEGSLGIGWHLFSWFGGKGSKRAQDEYARALFAQHADKLKALIPGESSFHAISALRVLAILRQNPRRVPGLGVRGAGTGGFNAEVNVHISVRREMRPWDQVSAVVRERGIQQVSTKSVPRPT